MFRHKGKDRVLYIAIDSTTSFVYLSSRNPTDVSIQVDLRKVNIAVLRPWIAKKVTEMIKFEDDVVVEYVFGMLEDKDIPVSRTQSAAPDGKQRARSRDL